tara:strand:+ start:138 stop:1310 length:1173 start_codon:yes stop_codon:yes gene_type:complete
MEKKQISKEFIFKLREICGKKKRSLHEPSFFGNEINEISKCIKSTYVSSKSDITSKFEKKIKEITKAKYAVATVNGTAALHMGLLSLKLKANNEVLIPSFNFVAAANAINYCGAIPNFIEIEESTLSVDPEKLDNYLKKNFKIIAGKCINKKTNRIAKGIIVPHIFGHPAKIDNIIRVSKKYKLFLIEDAAESLGSYYKKKHTGTFGDLGIISFNGNKIITTGGGGIVITNNRSIYKKISNLVELSKKKHPWKFNYNGIGFNLKMPGLNASLGLAQLKYLKKIIIIKKKIFKKYFSKFDGSKYFDLLIEPKNARSNYWLQNVKIKKKYSKYIDYLLMISNNNNYNTRPAWTLLHKQKHLRKCPKSNLNISEELHNRIISLPSSTDIIDEI